MGTMCLTRLPNSPDPRAKMKVILRQAPDSSSVAVVPVPRFSIEVAAGAAAVMPSIVASNTMLFIVIFLGCKLGVQRFESARNKMVVEESLLSKDLFTLLSTP